jgi:small-conductance mechanosensitive channel
MKTARRISIALLFLLLVTGFVVLFLTRSRPAASGAASQQAASLVDLSPLDTAQRLAALAVTPSERDFAQDALRLGDHAVDLAFGMALRNAVLAPHRAALSPEAQELQQHIADLQARVQDEQDRVARLDKLRAHARGTRKDSLDQAAQLAAASLALDKDALLDAQDDFARAGGDPRRAIELLQQEHEASSQHGAGASALTAASNSAVAAVELNTAASLLAQFRAWKSLRAKQAALLLALQQASGRAVSLAQRHDALEQQLAVESPQRKTLAGAKAALASGVAPPKSQTTAALGAVKHLMAEQHTLSDLTKSIEDEHGLVSTYTGWIAVVQLAQRARLHNIVRSFCWILFILILVLAGEPAAEHLLTGTALEKKRWHTLLAVVRFTLRAAATIFILLVIFGPPGEFATVLALAGAGLTVALKDFIVGFFGWFVLMGRNGIRPGDWVEINGVGGEVLEVGLLHTVLLESGNWSDAGHPTGRKVTFVNSFAIEGHYFNFSTSGQWLWDEVEFTIPLDAHPYDVADAILKLVKEQTLDNSLVAQQEWNRLAAGERHGSLSAEPALTIRPALAGIAVSVRYLTRAGERHAVRARIYERVVELLRGRNIPSPAPAPASAG